MMTPLSKREELFLESVRAHKILVIGLLVFGSLGVGIAAYAHAINIPVAKTKGFIITPLGYAILSAIFFKVQIVSIKLRDAKSSASFLTKSEMALAFKGTTHLKLIAVAIMFMGVVGAIAGVYGVLFRQVSTFGKVSTTFVVLSSFAYCIYGWLIYRSSGILKSLARKGDQTY